MIYTNREKNSIYRERLNYGGGIWSFFLGLKMVYTSKETGKWKEEGRTNAEF